MKWSAERQSHVHRMEGSVRPRGGHCWDHRPALACSADHHRTTVYDSSAYENQTAVDWNNRLKRNQLHYQTSETRTVVFHRNLRGHSTEMSIVSLWGQNVEECNESHFLNISNKKVDVYKDTGLKGWLFIFLPVLQSASWRGVHSTAIHLCAMGFIYTLQTFIRLIWWRKRGKRKEEKKNLMKTQLLSGANTLKTKKTPYKKYLRTIYTWSGGSPQRSAAKRTAMNIDGETALRNIASVLLFQSNGKITA